MKTKTQLGMVGLGRMGSNMVRRLIKGGVQCVVFNRSPQKVKDLVKKKAVGASSLADLAMKLQKLRAVWLMAPTVDHIIGGLLSLPGTGYHRYFYARFASRGAKQGARGYALRVRRASGEIPEMRNDS